MKGMLVRADEGVLSARITVRRYLIEDRRCTKEVRGSLTSQDDDGCIPHISAVGVTRSLIKGV